MKSCCRNNQKLITYFFVYILYILLVTVIEWCIICTGNVLTNSCCCHHNEFPFQNNTNYPMLIQYKSYCIIQQITSTIVYACALHFCSIPCTPKHSSVGLFVCVQLNYDFIIKYFMHKRHLVNE